MPVSSSAADATPSILWFRQDLRIADHPGLALARRDGPVLPVYIWSPEEEGDWPPGAASRWWLHHSLASLALDLEARGSRLILRRGPIAETLHALVRESGARRILYGHRYEPAARRQEEAVAAAFPVDAVLASTNSLLHEPWDISTQAGQPFQVFTPFWKACSARPDPPAPLPAPRTIPAPSRWPGSLTLDDLGLLPAPDWASGFRALWVPGETGARRQLRRFLVEALPGYPEDRNRPDLGGTSRLSPHLHFGEISPRQIWHAVTERAGADPRRGSLAGAEAYLREIGWREFAYHLLWHFPQTATEPLRAQFARFPWRRAPKELHAWQRGRTGYPLVDAGLRELWATGWMHNRVRMVVASFLVKDLLLPWLEGARWFWDTLVDADLANNTLGWQWTAGCGADAAPYFRIFNPIAQGERYDPEGAYTRLWIPELATPAGIEPGREYPPPLVDHGAARARALAALAATRTDATRRRSTRRPAPRRID